MKETITEPHFKQAFREIRPDNFSPIGLTVLFEYLTELEEDCGCEFELDVIGFCCDYSEMTTKEIEEEYGMSVDDLRDNTTVLDVDENTYIIRVF